MAKAPSQKSLPTAASHRLALGFTAIMAMMLVLILLGVNRMETLYRHLELVGDTFVRKLQLVSSMRAAARDRTVNLQKIILLQDVFDRDEQWMRYHGFAADFARDRIELLSMDLSATERDLLRSQGRLTGVAVPLQDEVFDLVSAGRSDDAHRLLVGEVIPAQDRVLAKLQALYDLQERTASRAASEAKKAYETTQFWVALVSTLAVVFGVLIAVFVSRQARIASRALQQEKELAQVTLYSIGEAVIRADANGVIEYMNPVAETATGWTSDQALGHRLADVFLVVYDDTRMPAQDPVVAVLEQGRVARSQDNLVLIARHGRELAIELTASPVHDQEDNAVGAVLVFRDVTEVRALGRELTYQATHDALTGLLNRMEFDNRIRNALEEVRATHVEHALCYFDLDYFKLVNDTCGHLAGDELLKQLSVRVKTIARRGDALARLGGDEFAILLTACSLEKAAEIANSIKELLAKFHFVWEDKSFDVAASIGVVRVAADSGDLSDVLRAADLSCRLAKEQGRNRIHVSWRNDITTAKREREINWIQRLNRAVERNQFVVYAQPIRPLGKDYTGCLFNEILVRMTDEQDKEIAPTAFLPAAERFHMMPTIDRWVVARVLSELATAKGLGEGDAECVNINLSGQSLCDPEFLEFINEQFAQTGVSPECVCFEITETAAITNLSSATQLIEILSGLGCSFALDDFGSGLSSFAYLKSMKVDYLKIDGAFIRNITDDPTDLAMVTSINQVAHTMGIKTIAEYVESEAIRDTVAGIGLDFAQGSAVAPTILFSQLLTRRAVGDIKS